MDVELKNLGSELKLSQKVQTLNVKSLEVDSFYSIDSGLFDLLC